MNGEWSSVKPALTCDIRRPRYCIQQLSLVGVVVREEGRSLSYHRKVVNENDKRARKNIASIWRSGL